MGPACSETKDAYATEIAVRVKPLEWKEHSGNGYRLFSADTEFGRFVYGTDGQSVAYHQGPGSDVDHGTEEEAKRAAEHLYGRLAMDKIRSLTVPALGISLEPRHFPVLGELRAILKKYAEDCDEARSYGGPTIYPRSPFNEGFARKFALELGKVEVQLATEKGTHTP